MKKKGTLVLWIFFYFRCSKVLGCLCKMWFEVIITSLFFTLVLFGMSQRGVMSRLVAGAPSSCVYPDFWISFLVWGSAIATRIWACTGRFWLKLSMTFQLIPIQLLFSLRPPIFILHFWPRGLRQTLTFKWRHGLQDAKLLENCHEEDDDHTNGKQFHTLDPHGS